MTKTTPKAKSPLRARMIEQMHIGNLSLATREEYLRIISNLARDTGPLRTGSTRNRFAPGS